MTRKAVFDYANKHHSDVPHIQHMLLAITEAKGELDLATWQLHVRADSAIFFKEQDTYNTCGSFLAEAGRYEAASAKLATLFITLVVMLQKLGADIEY